MFHHRTRQLAQQNFFSFRPWDCTTGWPQKRQGFAAAFSTVSGVGAGDAAGACDTSDLFGLFFLLKKKNP